MLGKISGSIIILLAVALGIFGIFSLINANWHYQNDYQNYWDLADKASTISQKSDYMDKFVNALQESGLQGSNANLIWQTQNSAFDQNFIALKSLQTRLQEIKTLDPNSFAYQTAIQQITAQEQGQADDMLSVFESCWYKTHYPFLWNLYGFLFVAGIILLGIVGGFIIAMDSDF